MLDIIDCWACFYVCAACDLNLQAFVRQRHCWHYSHQYQWDAASRTNIELYRTPLESVRGGEPNPFGPDLQVFKFCAEKVSNNPDSCHVLGAQAGIWPFCTDVGYLHGLAGDCRERNCSAQYLAAALPLRSIYIDEARRRCHLMGKGSISFLYCHNCYFKKWYENFVHSFRKNIGLTQQPYNCHTPPV